MALNVAVFKTRALTALVFVAVMLLGLFWNVWSFIGLFTIIHIGAWFEFFSIIEKIYHTTISKLVQYCFVVIGLLLSIVFGVLAFYKGRQFAVNNTVEILGYVLTTVVFIGVLIITLADKKMPFSAKKMCVVGLAYITMPIIMLLLLWFKPLILKGEFVIMHYENIFPCAILFSIWINDTMAYIVGSFIGKTPFSSISPKKTWEGTIGGVILCIVMIGFLYPIIMKKALFFSTITNYTWFAIAAICAIFGTLGDLFESKLKRMANIKDSGSFMPGHGGFLDRFDSLLIAVPFVWLYIQLFV
jgi:phosphatidate cytidylyltransferase